MNNESQEDMLPGIAGVVQRRTDGDTSFVGSNALLDEEQGEAMASWKLMQYAVITGRK